MPTPNINLIDLLFDGFTRGSELAQYVSVYNNLKQTSNDELMVELHNQNSYYFEKIIEQNNKIIKLLGGDVDVQQ